MSNMPGEMSFRKGRRIPATQIRTVWALIAMIPLALIVLLLCFLVLILLTPLIIYARIAGKHLKDPWSTWNKLSENP